MPEEKINFSKEVQDEITQFILKKTGAKAFVLGICPQTMPCEDSKQGKPCSNPKGHVISTLAANVEPEAWNSFTYGMYMALMKSIGPSTQQDNKSPYEPGTA